MPDRLSRETTRRGFLRRLLVGGVALAALPVLEAGSSNTAPAPPTPAGAPKPAESKPAESKPAAPAAQPASTTAAQAAPASNPGTPPDHPEEQLLGRAR